MCGIAGLYDPGRPPTPAELEPMVAILRHRGPDADGCLVAGPVALGMRRLSIIDLVSGDQPVHNEDGQISVVFNGEIYNYLELRAELIALGHRFATTGDTEVLVHGYESWGVELLERLNGMFALALYDGRARRLLLARDRMGVKPLYYAVLGSRVAFASEIKALLRHPGLDLSWDSLAVADYLQFGYVPGDRTLFRGVRRLLPGHFAVVDGSGMRTFQWWNLAEVWERAASLGQQSAEELAELFDDAVRLRMRSDVPVAAFLSGGFDSSVVSLTAQAMTTRPIRAYTVGFDEPLFDERPYASAVASAGGMDHHTVMADPGHALDQLSAITWFLDEPVNDSAVLPAFLVSRRAALDVKVCLSGLGGDELFGGYSRYFRRRPGRIRRIFHAAPAVAGALAPALRWRAPLWAEELRIASDDSLLWRSYLQELQVFDSVQRARLGLSDTGRGEAIIEKLWNRYPGQDWVGRRQFVDQQTYLPDQILALTDRLSMASSLEVRTPFMDYRLVALAAGVSGEHKQIGGIFKILLREALGHRLPLEARHRPKWGFDSPLPLWLRRADLASALTRVPRALADWFEPRATETLVAEANRTGLYARHVWGLLTLAVWRRVYRFPQQPDTPLAEILADA